MKQRPEVSCTEVLNSFAVEPNHDRSTMERYLREFPQYAVEIASLSNELSRPPSEKRELIAKDRAIIDAAWRTYSSSPSSVLSNVFSKLSIPEIRILAQNLGVRRQVIAAFREQRVKLESIPGLFLSRLAGAMNVTVEEIRTALTIPLSVDFARCNKSEEKPTAPTPVTFEQLLIEAETPAEKRAELMAEGE